MHPSRSVLVFSLLLSLAIPLSAHAQDRCKLLATNWGSPLASLWDIDIATGAASNQRNDPSFTEQAVGLTRLPGGAFYGLGIDATLYQIDPVTADITPVGSLGIFPLEGDIDFDPTSNVLYGINIVIGSERGLYTVDHLTGSGTIVGPTQEGDLSAMAFDAGGTLYVLDTSNDELLTVDPGTGDVLTSADVSFDFDFIAGMDFHPVTGVLYVGEGGTNSPYRLFTLDTSTGTATEIGETGLPSSTAGISGLEFFCPEQTPALGPIALMQLALCLVAAGVATLALRRSN